MIDLICMAVCAVTFGVAALVNLRSYIDHGKKGDLIFACGCAGFIELMVFMMQDYEIYPVQFAKSILMGVGMLVAIISGILLCIFLSEYSNTKHGNYSSCIIAIGVEDPKEFISELRICILISLVFFITGLSIAIYFVVILFM